MRKVILIILVTLKVLFIQGQNIAVSNDKNNFLYRGIENPVSIAVSGIKTENIIVKMDNCIFHKIRNKYVVIPTEGNRVTVRIFKIIKKDTLEIGQSEFRIKDIPDPIFFIPNNYKRENDSIEKGKLINGGGLIGYVENFDYETSCIVKYFEIATINNNDTLIYKSESNRFTKEILELFRQTGKGSTYYIQNALVSMSDGTIRKLKYKLKIIIK